MTDAAAVTSTPLIIPLDAAAGLRAAAALAALGGAAELALALWAYRKPGFRSVRVRERRGREGVVACEGGGGNTRGRDAAFSHPSPLLLPSLL